MAERLTHKVCPACLIDKPRVEFYERKGVNWISFRCKRCTIIKNAQWKKANPEKVHLSQNKYYRKNTTKCLAAIRVWTKNHREQAVLRCHSYRAKKKSNTIGKVTPEAWSFMVNAYGNKCLCCGCVDKKLTIDHVIPISQGGAHSLSNLQPLCKSCNCSKNKRAFDYRPWRIDG